MTTCTETTNCNDYFPTFFANDYLHQYYQHNDYFDYLHYYYQHNDYFDNSYHYNSNNDCFYYY